MSRPAVRTIVRPISAAVSLTLAAVVGLLVATLLVAVDEPAQTGALAPAVAAQRTTANPVTPGDFTGYGFDQCLAPTQAAMDRWLTHSPFLAVGIYISGNSRACRHQPNLTPTWVRTQLAKGWRLLPITLGPQSTCVGRYPKYGPKIDPTISNNSTGGFRAARNQGVREAGTAVDAAKALGIVPGSTLWYDLEGWSNYRHATCRESALAFLSGWTTRIRQLGYVSGVYSSAGSGMKILDDARVQRRKDVVLPDRIWIARWDGKANTSTSYIREDGWRPGGRVKQYRGGHDEVWGGVRINIDSNFLDVGRGSVAPREVLCGGVRVSYGRYPVIKAPAGSYRPSPAHVKALQCLLKIQRIHAGPINGVYDAPTRAAVHAWRERLGLRAEDHWGWRMWTSLLATGTRPVLKIGSAGHDVRRLQRALNATNVLKPVPVDGVFGPATRAAVVEYQKRVRVAATGVAPPSTWGLLAAGIRKR